MGEMKTVSNAKAKPLFEQFLAEVREQIEGKARRRGYSEAGTEGYNPLFEFNKQFFPCHPQGEIVYKLVRGMEEKDPEDIVKVAAWAFLIWKDLAMDKGRGHK
jgi:hypothetical protein